MSTVTDPAGALRVWWIPQIPGTPFHVSVNSLVEAKLLLDTLGNYDLFQLENRIKGDYSNAGGLQVVEKSEDGLEWCEWYDPDSGQSIDEFTLEELRELEAVRLDTLRKLFQPLATFIDKFDAKPLSQTADEFYCIHTGSEWEASLKLSDLRALSAELKKGGAS